MLATVCVEVSGHLPESVLPFHHVGLRLLSRVNSLFEGIIANQFLEIQLNLGKGLESGNGKPENIVSGL